MKKFLSLITAVIMVFAVTACSKNTDVVQDTPENALKSYLESIKASNALNITKTTREEYTQEDVDNMNMLLNDKAFGKKMQKECKKNLEYTIGTSEVQGDMAYVSVDFKYTDMSAAFKEALPLYMSYFIANLSDSNASDEKSSAVSEAEEFYVKSFEEAYTKNPPKTTEESTTVTLKNTDGKWYVAVSNELSGIVTCGIMGIINNAN